MRTDADKPAEPKRRRCFDCGQTAECWVWLDTEGKSWALCQRCLGRWIDAERRRLQSTTR
jgi:hypothetical protein